MPMGDLTIFQGSADLGQSPIFFGGRSGRPISSLNFFSRSVAFWDLAVDQVRCTQNVGPGPKIRDISKSAGNWPRGPISRQNCFNLPSRSGGRPIPGRPRKFFRPRFWVGTASLVCTLVPHAEGQKIGFSGNSRIAEKPVFRY